LQEAFSGVAAEPQQPELPVAISAYLLRTMSFI
jgi:hypothetical protein